MAWSGQEGLGRLKRRALGGCREGQNPGRGPDPSPDPLLGISSYAMSPENPACLSQWGLRLGWVKAGTHRGGGVLGNWLLCVRERERNEGGREFPR